MFGLGTSGFQLSITARPNDSGVRRRATVTVTSGGLSQTLTISQAPVLTDIRGTRVIECFGRNGYISINGSATSTTIECVTRSNADRPIWNFVHVFDNVFAIRNDTTGRYFTETGGNLRHEARISGTGTDYDIRQEWRLIPDTGGTYRIRSVSSDVSPGDTLYVQEGVNHILNNPNLTLSSRSTSHNRQLWRIGYIWHTDGSWVGFWPGTINIRVVPIAENNRNEFNQAMSTARTTWTNALGVTFNDDIEGPENANIRVYWGTPFQFSEELNLLPWVSSMTYGDVIAPLISLGGRVLQDDSFQAGGAARNVFSLHGTHWDAMKVGIWSHQSRSADLATFVATHELGHALGYWGHSPNNDDVMRRSPGVGRNPRTTLNPAEIEHIRQIYRRFR